MNNTKWINYLTEQQDFEDDKTDYGSEESFFKNNLKVLEHYYGSEFDEENLESADILDEIEIGKRIGEGAYGVVFDIVNSSRAIKIYRDSVAVDKDQQRFERIINMVFKGTAQLEDMHIFDQGELGTSGYYYAIMPKIIPLSNAPFRDKSDIFEWVAEGNQYAASAAWERKVNYTRFNQMVLKFAIEEMQLDIDAYGAKEENENKAQEDADKYALTIDRIIRAGYRAYLMHDGEDLHAGNIGYLPQKPDVFFYFDM